MSGRTLTNVVNEQTVALNALIYGYAGHSLVTPHAALQQIWWTEERINEKVTKDFVTSRLRPNERERLTKPVGFGDLTDDTYIEWILERARRLFLVLAEIGEAEKIFTAVQNSWDDDDLPLQKDDIEQLELSNRRDPHADSRFYHTQFTFLLRELREGVHVDYAPNEELPLEYVMGLPPAVALQNWPRVHLPKKPNKVYVRRKFPLGTSEAPNAFEANYILDVESSRMIEHEHIAPVWASYTYKGVGYTLTDFVGQHTLKTFIDHRNPTQYQRLSKPDRRYLLLNWLHCLADAMAILHLNGFCHSSIRPSNIIIDEHNNVAFSDIGSLETFQKDKRPDPMDVYIYSAPETHALHQRDVEIAAAAPAPNIGTPRKPSVASKNSTGSTGSNGSQRQKLTKVPTNEFSGFNFGFRKTKPAPKPRSRAHDTEKADVFSLGCVFLEILTFMLKKKPHEFIKHRSSKQNINIGGKSSRTDSSFHANPERIDSWMKVIEDASFEQDHDSFRAIPEVMNLLRAMLNRAPDLRPNARDIRDRLLGILLHYTAIPDIHCGMHKHDVDLAVSSTEGSDRASSTESDRSTISSGASTMSFSTVSSSSDIDTISDTDTIRHSSSTTMRVSSILDSYRDRTTLCETDDDESDAGSIRTVGRTFPMPVNKVHDKRLSQRSLGPPPTPPISPTSSNAPVSPTSAKAHQTSVESTTTVSRGNLWNKPFFKMP
ncbi:kinase domain-containing protein [Pleomassaria siparia CBS 279.74]|uniref:Kinase domain-containing protein n=1 Tax=Pleomassaria siparia CBS 279.74 TaxID=1314801 RepID=A0A6G1JWR4_9PLEO|nr:kinase domain-containing protein [Pleomassaria siparia CBS 279.74]